MSESSSCVAMIVAPLHPAALKPLQIHSMCRRPVAASAARQPHKVHVSSITSSPKGKDLVDLAVFLNQLNSATWPKETKVPCIQQAADAVRVNLCRPHVHDPYRLSFCEVESLIDCMVSLHDGGITSHELGMHALATMACLHDARRSGPPKHFRNSVRWLQRKELGYSISLLPTDIHSLVPSMSLLRLLWAASLMLGPGSTQKPGEKPQHLPGGSLPHRWADNEVTVATAKLAADVLTPLLTRQAQIEDRQSQVGQPSSKAATAAARHLNITSPKLVGLAYLCHSSARIRSMTHEPLGLVSHLLFCIDTSIDNRLTQILSSPDECNDLEVDELAKLSNLIAIGADTAV